MSTIHTKQDLNKVNVNVNVTPDTYIAVYLASLNGILNLSHRELEVLTEFVRLYDPKLQDVCHSDVRRRVQSNLDFPSRAALNNYIKFLTDKKALSAITEPKNGYKFHPLVHMALLQPEKVTLTFKLPVGA